MSGLDFLDCNAMVGRVPAPPPGFFHEPERLVAEMDRAGIRRALTYHAIAAHHDPTLGNDLALEATAGNGRLIPCWVGQPHYTGESQRPEQLIAQMREAGVRGLRLFPLDHQFRIGEWCSGALLEAMAACGCPVLLSITQTSWDEIAAALKAHPALNLIVLDAYYRVDRYAYPLWETYQGLRIETGTYCGHREIEQVCRRFGADRLAFGTGLPFRDPGAAISRITYAEVSDEDKAAIAGGTLERLLNWGENDA